MVCTEGHCFDLAAKGYVNLAAAGSNDLYDEALFAARREVFEAGFFVPLYMVIAQIAKSKRGVWLDAGCGEGSGLRYMAEGLGLEMGVKLGLGLCSGFGATASAMIGADLSKEGIRMAAASTADMEKFVWLVADLARLPLADASVDVLLNVLSPANYAEFGRVLAADGLVVKVIPGARYLQELRAAFFADSEKETHEAQASAEAFMRAYPEAKVLPVRYEAGMDAETMRHLLDMTPLTQNVSQAEKDAFVARGACDVTADFIILVNEQQ